MVLLATQLIQVCTCMFQENYGPNLKAYLERWSLYLEELLGVQLYSRKQMAIQEVEKGEHVGCGSCKANRLSQLTGQIILHSSSFMGNSSQVS